MSSSSQLPGAGGQCGPGPARTLHRCCITRHTCGSHATCGTSGTRRGSVGCGRGILAARRTGQFSRMAQSRLTWHVHWHGLPLRKSRGTSAGLATTAALTAAALATTRLEGWLRHRTNRTRSRARVRATRVDGPKVRFTKRVCDTGTDPQPPPPKARLSLRRARLHLLALWQSSLEDRNIAKKRCGSIGCGKGWEEVNTGNACSTETRRGQLSLLKRTDGDSRYLPSPRASHVQCSRTCQLVNMYKM